MSWNLVDAIHPPFRLFCLTWKICGQVKEHSHLYGRWGRTSRYWALQQERSCFISGGNGFATFYNAFKVASWSAIEVSFTLEVYLVCQFPSHVHEQSDRSRHLRSELDSKVNFLSVVQLQVVSVRPSKMSCVTCRDSKFHSSYVHITYFRGSTLVFVWSRPEVHPPIEWSKWTKFSDE